jgi:hypothetical protein
MKSDLLVKDDMGGFSQDVKIVKFLLQSARMTVVCGLVSSRIAAKPKPISMRREDGLCQMSVGS